ncbi:hypothetical protein HDU78_001090, partial [Chytriomyces hyalinus]
MHRDNRHHLFAVPYPVMSGTPPQLKRITIPNLRQPRVLNAPPKGPGNVNILASPVEIVARGVVPVPTDLCVQQPSVHSLLAPQPRPQASSTMKLATPAAAAAAARMECHERQAAIHGFANQEIQSVTTTTLANF